MLSHMSLHVVTFISYFIVLYLRILSHVSIFVNLSMLNLVFIAGRDTKMKKLLALTLILLFAATGVAFAEDETTSAISDAVAEAVKENPIQGVEIEKSGGVIVFEKQPQTDTPVQYVRVHKCGLVAIILLNGKVKE